MSRLRIASLVVGMAVAAVAPASASLLSLGSILPPIINLDLVTCSFTVTPMTFTTINALPTTVSNTTATIGVTCSGISVVARVDICIRLGAGSGGVVSNERRLVNGANTLQYKLFKPDGTTEWGGLAGAPTSTTHHALSVNVPLLGTGTANLTINGRLLGGQTFTTPSTGTYSSTFSTAADIEIDYSVYDISILNPAANCVGTESIIGGNVRSASPTLAVSAQVAAVCTVATTAVNFGNNHFLDHVIDAQGAITVTCTANFPFAVGLNNGSHGLAPSQRRMASGGNYIQYELYRDASRTLPFTTGANGVAHTAAGPVAPIPVYGRVPIQTTPPPGTYQDTVVITVTY